ATTIQVPALPADADTTTAPSPNENAGATEPAQAAPPPVAEHRPEEATVSPSPAQAPARPAAPAVANPFVSIEDLVALQIASEPQVSPDGLLIAYVVL